MYIPEYLLTARHLDGQHLVAEGTINILTTALKQNKKQVISKLHLEPASVVYQLAHSPGVGEVMGSILGPNRVIAKHVKSCT